MQKSSRRLARKAPVQSRSRATVDAILEASIRILERDGPDALTTSRVAETAGVSVGTLYQYFGGRDSILDALQDRELARATELLKGILDNAATLGDREVAAAVIDGLMGLYRVAPALHRLLAVDGLRVTPKEHVLAFDLRIVAAIRGFLSLSTIRLRRQNLDAASFVIYQSVRASMLAYLLERPAGVDEAALAAELTDLILSYLVEPVRNAAYPPPKAARTGR
jgi:AcrR family transcriptional regulator